MRHDAGLPVELDDRQPPRAQGGPFARIVEWANRATLVAWRVPVEESAAIVSRLTESHVIVRDLPGRGLVRASVGWWTNDDDLERLVAGL